MNASNPLDTLIEQSRKARDHAGHNLADDRRGQAQSAAQPATWSGVCRIRLTIGTTPREPAANISAAGARGDRL